MVTTNFNWPEVSAAQDQKEVTLNNSLNLIEDLLSETEAIVVGVSNARTLTSAEFRENFFFSFTDDASPPTAQITLTVPAIKRGVFYIVNGTSFDMQVEITSQPVTAPIIAAGESALLASDGTNVRSAGGGAGASSSNTIKEAVRAATTVDGTLATAYENGDTVDGVTLATGDRILLKDQTAGAENGIYTVNASGAPTRAADYNADIDLEFGHIVAVVEGTTNANTIWQLETDGPYTIDTTALVYGQAGGGAGGGSVAIEQEDAVIVAAASSINFKGPVSVVDAGSNQADVTIGTEGITRFLSSGFRGALVTRATDQTAANYTTLTAIPFDAEINDTDAFHDNATNNTRLTIPAGVTKVRLTANVAIELLDIDMTGKVVIRKNGATVQGSAFTGNEVGLDTSPFYSISTHVLDVVEGDYFECALVVETDTSITVATETTFGVEVVETSDTVNLSAVVVPLNPKHRGALVKMSADQTTVNATGNYQIPFNTEIRDTDAFHDNATNNTRLTVPAGVTKVRLHANVVVTSLSGGEPLLIGFFKNGTQINDGSAEQRAIPATTSVTNILSIASPTYDAVEGDYFEVNVFVPTDTSITVASSRTSFAIEVVEEIGAGTQPTGFIAVQPKHRGAVIKLGVDQTGANYTSFTRIPFDTELSQTKTSGGHSFYLGADFTFATTDVNTTDDEITEAAHGMITGDGPVQFSSTTTLPTGISASTNYWIIKISNDVFQIATSIANALAGTQVDITSQGTGTHTCERQANLVVPIGVTKVKLTNNILINGLSADLYAATVIQKDAATIDGSGWTRNESGNTQALLNSNTVVLEVTPGEVFTTILSVQTDTSITVSEQGTFSIEAIETDEVLAFPGVTVERPHIGCLVTLAADDTGVNATGAITRAWDSEVYDTGYRGTPFHDNVTNNTRITIPAGVTKVQLFCNIRFTLVTVNVWTAAVIQKNGTTFGVGDAYTRQEVGNQPLMSIATGVLEVVEGDYFEVLYQVETDTSITVEADSTFGMTVVETSDAEFPPEQIDVWFDAIPTASTDVFVKVANRRFSLNDDFSGSRGWAQSGPNGGAVVFDVERNGTKIGEISFADSTGAAQTATFTTTAAIQEDFEVGDRLHIVAPANLQSMSEIAIALYAFRT